jgi:hypothetical protein
MAGTKHSNTEKENLPTESRKWTVALSMATIYAFVVIPYVYALTGTWKTWDAWNMITAGIAGFLFASSLSASILYYYIGWPQMQWGYQKQLGILAFWLAFLYCVQLLYIKPEIYLYGFWDNLLTPNFVYGLSAMIIFGLMVLLNSHVARKYVAWEIVKFVLGLGFVGYALLVLRAVYLEWPIWQTWFVHMDTLPTTRFMLSVLAMLVLLARLSIPLHAALRKKNQ